jgi:hypothetical protein
MVDQLKQKDEQLACLGQKHSLERQNLAALHKLIQGYLIRFRMT